MAGVHATGGFALLAGSAAFFVFAVLCTRFPKWDRALSVAGHILAGLISAQAIVGGILYAQGRRPVEPLHFLYGAVAVAALPAARSFSSEAPPKAKAGVMAIAGLLVGAMIWRLFATG